MPGRKISRFFLVIAVAFALPSSVLVPAEFPRASSPIKKIALTFDDGPHPFGTRKLITLLSQYQVPATFFIVGKVASRYPHVLRKLVSQGHELSNHTWSHPNIEKISTEALLAELKATQKLIYDVTGKKTSYFRTPGSTEHYIRKRFSVPAGFQLVLWDVHSRDNNGISSEAILKRLRNQIKDGDILLFHNSNPHTREALRVLIPELKNQGFEFRTVSDLVREKTHKVMSVSKPSLIRG